MAMRSRKTAAATPRGRPARKAVVASDDATAPPAPRARKPKPADSASLTPLGYMLAVIGDPDADPKRRDDMAKAAAPYVHARLSSIEAAGKGGGQAEVSELSDDDLETIAERGAARTDAPARRKAQPH